MDEYRKEPSEALQELAGEKIDEETYLERTEEGLVEVLTEEAAATAEFAKERKRVNKVLEEGAAKG